MGWIRNQTSGLLLFVRSLMGVCATHMYMLVTVCKLGMKDCHLSSSNFVLHDQNKSMFTVRNSSCRKVMFSQVSVCPRGGSCTSPMARHHTPLGRHPGQTPHPPARHPLGRHPPGQTATAADGTHPTGMHSCFKFSFLFLQDILCRNQLELLKLLNVSCYAVQDILKVACEACATKPMKVGKKNREVAEYICLKHVLLMT